MTTNAMRPEVLREVREGLGLTQSAFAELLGFTARSISRYETGEQVIPMVVALACAAIAKRLDPLL